MRGIKRGGRAADLLSRSIDIALLRSVNSGVLGFTRVSGTSSETRNPHSVQNSGLLWRVRFNPTYVLIGCLEHCAPLERGSWTFRSLSTLHSSGVRESDMSPFVGIGIAIVRDFVWMFGQPNLCAV